MFGYVSANYGELTQQQRDRYGAVYCGVCRRIREQSSGIARLGLSYDMAFLALLLMSLYEPEERTGANGCMLHPIKRRPWIDNDYIRYCADMNVALAYYNCMDDWKDEGKLSARVLAAAFGSHCPDITRRWPRQCAAIAEYTEAISQSEKENCANPDVPAGLFGQLMAELLVYEEDLWAEPLRKMGNALGRFIYLMDAAEDYKRDEKEGKYNPFRAMGMDEDPEKWEEYLVLTMGRCTGNYEKLPLVQDKALLDNILYSGVWVKYRESRRKEEHHAG